MDHNVDIVIASRHTSSAFECSLIHTHTLNALDDERKLNTSHNEPNNNLDVYIVGFPTLRITHFM